MKVTVRLIALSFIALLAVLAGFTCFYTVQPDEEAVIIRLGRYHGTFPPGAHFKIPWGVDRLFKIQTTKVHQEEFGFRTHKIIRSRTKYSNQNYDDESLMLTGDLNVADVEWVVQYKISDPYKYLFQARDPIQNIRDVSESIMRRVVGDRLVSSVLTTGRVEISSKAKVLMQGVIDRYDIGILIVSVKLQDVNPPNSVKPAFNEVNEARQEQEKLINQAEEEYNKVIPAAKGKAEQLISKAEGYADALVARAEGDASRFKNVYIEYRRSPKITQKRIYLETMEKIYKRFEKLTIVDPSIKGLLPVFKNAQLGEKK